MKAFNVNYNELHGMYDNNANLVSYYHTSYKNSLNKCVDIKACENIIIIHPWYEADVNSPVIVVASRCCHL